MLYYLDHLYSTFLIYFICSYCSSRSSNGDVHHSYDNRPCFCDALCHLYGDCCEGLPPGNDTAIDPGIFTCSESFHGLLQEVSSHPIAVVNACPEAWLDGEVRSLCSNDSHHVFKRWPVVDSRNILYKNPFCAACNDVTDFLYYKSHVECSEELELDIQSLDEYIRTGFCSILFSPPTQEAAVHFCKPATSTCSPDWGHSNENETIRRECEQGGLVRYVYDVDVPYKNRACATCNFISWVFCEPMISSQSNVQHMPMMKPIPFHSISIMFDVNVGSSVGSHTVQGSGTSEMNITIESSESCPTGHVFDPFISSCRFLSCGQGYYYTDGGCAARLSQTSASSNNTCAAYILLEQSEYIVYQNGSLVELASNIIHLQFTYELNDTVGTAKVCTHLQQNYTYHTTSLDHGLTKSSTLDVYLSALGQVISILALTVHLVVYSVLPRLRNLPGCNIMCLSATLLIAQLVFLIGASRTEVHGVCVTFAIVIHYTFLASFCWMHVMSFDLWITFSKKMFVGFRDDPAVCFRRYHIYSWVIPGIVVCVAGLVNFNTTVNEPLSPAYGNGLCWISNQPALMLFFGLPVALILLSNFVFYIRTIINIRNVTKLTQDVIKKKPDRGYLWVYTKLCVIMGLTWVFGFVAMFSKLTVVWYLFVLFNSLQGLFICITFVCTKQVLHLLREKFFTGMLPTTSTTNTTNGTSSTYVAKSQSVTMQT